MKAKELAKMLEASNFAPAKSDNLGSRGQRSLNFVEVLKQLDVEIDVSEDATLLEVAEAVERAFPLVSATTHIWLPDFTGGMSELRLQHEEQMEKSVA